MPKKGESERSEEHTEEGIITIFFFFSVRISVTGAAASSLGQRLLRKRRRVEVAGPEDHGEEGVGQSAGDQGGYGGPGDGIGVGVEISTDPERIGPAEAESAMRAAGFARTRGRGGYFSAGGGVFAGFGSEGDDFGPKWAGQWPAAAGTRKTTPGTAG